MNGDEPTRPLPLKTKFQIGGTQAPVNYKFQESCFHIDDTPPQKIAAKHEVQASLRSKILSTERPSWDQATTESCILRTNCYKRTFANGEMNHGNMYQYNYRAEKLPDKYPTLLAKPTKFNQGILEVLQQDIKPGETFGDKRMQRGICKRTEELPNHPDLRDSVPWNSSVVKSKQDLRTTFKAAEAARIVNSEKSIKSLESYKTPQELYTEQLQRERDEKAKKRAMT
ncbi:hypothetical protein H310_04024 [Aphanomyces invadans]|uniref:Uncharacterized protein n=1 Tax=Aphanomyces invadans TaxID=157072 RepID=A0A024UF96_9STRA|nr:hypothetical protein H310_04024 [Aphanomyces invadans]ETW04924.1 hypothetical protein H310_04024 [Aphanomyces invadans]|eukprot:XP_008866362.1 hypothetical protein H310_04024 [Aphanomyces invadans]